MAAKRDTAFYLEGVRDLERALRRLPKELEDEVKDASGRIAERAVRETRAAAGTRAERKAAKSIRSRRGKVPTIAAGGGTRTEGGPMFFGTEFGGDRNIRTRQFRTHRGTQGYFFYPTIRRHGRDWVELWLDGIDRATRVWDN
jgi:hypothetical protein